MAMLLNRPLGLIAFDEPVEVAEIPTIETWDRHDCKVTVSQPEGFLCKVQLRAKLDFPPEDVFDILVDPDNSRYFSTVTAVTYRKVLEDNHRGKEKVEVEQAAQWRFLFFSGCFFTRLFVFQDKPEGTVEFKLAREGMMKNFEGRWEIRPFDQHSLDEISGHTNTWGNIGYRFRNLLPHHKPEATLITLEQSILPAAVPPKWFQGYMVKVASSVIQTIIKDLRDEIDRVKKGRPIPNSQLKKLKKAKRLVDSTSRKREKASQAAASLSMAHRLRPCDFLF